MIKKILNKNFGNYLINKNNLLKLKNNKFLSINNKFISFPNLFNVKNILRISKNQFCEKNKFDEENNSDPKIFQKAIDLINNLKNMNFSNDNKFVYNILKLIKLPSIESKELRNIMEENLETLIVLKSHEINLMINQFDQIILNEDFHKLLNYIQDRIVSNIKFYNPETLSLIIVCFSIIIKKDDLLWDLIEKLIIQNLDKFELRHLSQILFSFQLLGRTSNDLNSKIIKKIETMLDKLTVLDTFRICFGLSKVIITSNEVTEVIYKKVEEYFVSNISQFNLFQISHIIFFFSEISTYDETMFPIVEKEITSKYFTKLDEIFINPINLENILENNQFLFNDLTFSMITLCEKRTCSESFLRSYLKYTIKYKDVLTHSSIEKLSLITIGIAEMLNVLDITKDSDLNLVIEILKEKILKDKLLLENNINPFILMMTLSKFRIQNKEIWGQLIEKVVKQLVEEKIVVDSNLISNLIYAFGEYEIYNLNEENKPNDQYENNKDILWKWIIYYLNLINADQFNDTQIATIAINFSKLSYGNPKTWEKITNIVETQINQFDHDSYLKVCMAISGRDINKTDLWNKLEEKGLLIINELSLDGLTLLIYGFLKIEKCKKIWIKIEEILASDIIFEKLDFNYFSQIQYPLAIKNVCNTKIWEKFEEIVFNNFNKFENDNDLSIKTIQSFYLMKKGSPEMWKKLSVIIRKKMNTYTAEDLGKIIMCMNSKVDEKIFWSKFHVCLEKIISTANIISCGILLNGMKSNSFLKDKSSIIMKLTERLPKPKKKKV